MSTKDAQARIETGRWTYLHTTIVDQASHYAVQQYRDVKGLIWTVALSREGIVQSVR